MCTYWQGFLDLLHLSDSLPIFRFLFDWQPRSSSALESFDRFAKAEEDEEELERHCGRTSREKSGNRAAVAAVANDAVVVDVEIIAVVDVEVERLR